MNDQQMDENEMDAVLRTWMQDEPAEQPDRSRVVGNVVGRLGSTRRRRRWPFSVFRRTVTPMPPETPDRQPNPIPATNGHTPTTPGRTQSMFSPVKAITASAVVFALGGVLLIAQPFGQQGDSVPGAAIDTETVPASLVTGEMGWASSCASPTVEVDGDVTRTLDHLCAPQTWTADDPRLSGQATSTWNTDTYLVNGERKSVIANAYYLRNEHGGWACRSHLLVDGTGGGGSWEGVETVMCEGEGEYDGLSAIINFDEPVHDGTTAQPMVGLIFQGDAPPHPAPPAAE